MQQNMGLLSFFSHSGHGILDSFKQVCLLKMTISYPKMYNNMVIDVLHIYGYGFRNPIKKPTFPTLQVIWVYTMFTVGAKKHKIEEIP